MSSQQNLVIDMRGIKDGASSMELHVDDAYFQSLDEQEISRGSVDVCLDMAKAVNVCDISIHVSGEVVVACDLCLNDMLQPINASYKLVVKQGEEYNDEGDVITVDDSGLLDLSWLIYEDIALAVPARHVHEAGQCDSTRSTW